MFLILQVVSVFLVSLAMALALAHALELPGKLRLDKNAYWTVQSIYYPGFTIGGGFGEGGGITAVLILLLLTPARSHAFPWTLIALIALLAMHLAYWVFTHPVNKFWLKERKLEGFSGGFFHLDPLKRSSLADSGENDWTRARNRWEYSHVIRAVLGTISLVSLVVAVAVYARSM
jgi:hypothetical protein